MKNLIVFYYKSPDNEWEFLGNGVVISNSGIVCTVGHLFLNSEGVDPNGDFKCESYNNPELNQIIRVEHMDIISYDEDAPYVKEDWAVFESEIFKGFENLGVSEIILNDDYLILGINENNNQLDEFSVETRLIHTHLYPYMIYGTLPPEIVRGTSGSPVFNQEGNIVGLVSGEIPYTYPNANPPAEIRVLSIEHVLNMIQ